MFSIRFFAQPVAVILLLVSLGISGHAQNASLAWKEDFFHGNASSPNSFKLIEQRNNYYYVGGHNAHNITITKLDTSGIILWQREISGQVAGPDEITAMKFGPLGYLYVTGFITNSQSTDVITLCIDTSGVILWRAEYNHSAGNGTDWGLNIACAPNGKIFVCGTVTNSSGDKDAAVIGYGATGNLLWQYVTAGNNSGTDRFNSIAIDSSGLLYIAGEVRDSLTDLNGSLVCLNQAGGVVWTRIYDSGGDENFASLILGNNALFIGGEKSNMCLVKYDLAGNLQWVCPTTATDFSDLCMDVNGNVFLAGYTNPITGSDVINALLVNPVSGAQIWYQSYLLNSFTGIEQAYACASDAAGNYYIAGRCNTTSTHADQFVMKAQPSGTFDWCRFYSGSSPAFSLQSAQDVIIHGSRIISCGYVYNANSDATLNFYNTNGTINNIEVYDDVTGTTRYPVLLENGNSVVQVSSSHLPSALLISRYAYNGTRTDHDTLITSSEIVLQAGAFDGTQHLVVAGSINGSQGADYWLARFDANGDTLWTKQISSAGNMNDAPRSLVCDVEGNIYCSGNMAGDASLLKLDSSGNTLWNYTVSGNGVGYDTGIKVELAQDSGVYFLALVFNTTTAADYLVAKVAPDSTLLWTRIFGGGNGSYDQPVSLLVNSANDAIACGTIQTSNAGQDMYVASYSDQGALNWTLTDSLNGVGNELIADAVLGNGATYLTGSMTDTSGSVQLLAAKISASGVLAWTNSWSANNSYDDQGSEIAWSTHANSPVITGYSMPDNSTYNNITLLLDSTGAITDTFYYLSPTDEWSTRVIASEHESALYTAGFVNLAGGDDHIYTSIYKYCIGNSLTLPAAYHLCEGALLTILPPAGFSNYQWTPAGLFTPDGNGNMIYSGLPDTAFTLSALNSYGCISAAEASIIVHNRPHLILSTDSLTLCSGDTATLNVSGVVTCSWNPASNIFTNQNLNTYAWPSSTQQYVAIGYDPWGCADSTSLKITVLLPPMIQYSLPMDTVCLDSTQYFINTAVPAGGYYWGAHVIDTLFVSADSGLHVISYIYNDPLTGCASMTSDSLYVDLCSGLPEYNNSTISFYPNPASTFIRWNSGGQYVSEVTLLDGQGRIIQTLQRPLQSEIDVNDYSRGLYFLQITTEAESVILPLLLISE